MKQLQLNALSFSEFLKDFTKVHELAESYQYFLLMDILHYKKPEIEELDFIEYEEALNYAVTTYKMRSMYEDKKKPSSPESVTFNHEEGWDDDPTYDPNFFSEVDVK